MLKIHRLRRLRLRAAAFPLLGIIGSLVSFIWAAVQQVDWLVSKWPQGRPMPPAEAWIFVGCLAWLALIAFWPELDKVEQPDVALTWDWAEGQRTLASDETEKHILIHNRSTEWVYNIQIESLSLADEMTFDLVNEIEPRETHVASARWDGMSSLTSKYALFFCKEANVAAAQRKKWHYTKLHNRGLSPHFMKIPMRLSYETANRAWESEWDFVFDIGDESLFVKRSQKRI